MKWFVGVPAARVLGKNEDRVRFSNEPLQRNIKWGHGSGGRHRYGMASSVYPAGAARSILGDSTLVIRKVAGYGLPGLFAKQCNFKSCEGSTPLPSAPLVGSADCSKMSRLDGEADIISRF